jgi:hypothetical protein
MPRVCSTLTITNTTAQNILPAVAKVINLVKSIQFQSTNSTSTTFNILTGATVVATFRTPANMVPASVSFDYPLVSEANQAIQVQATTTGGNVLFNFQGETVLKI